jgi:hypothetical protein
MVEPLHMAPLEGPPRTAWHPMLVSLLERFLPRGWRLTPELPLSRLAQRVDVVVVRAAEHPAPSSGKLRSILGHLRAHTLIEFKGPTDDIAGDDFLTLLGYGYQYMRLNRVRDPTNVCLMVICDHLTGSFLAQAERCGAYLLENEPGIWKGQIGRFVLHGVETGKVARRKGEELLYVFSRDYLENPRGTEGLDREDAQVYLWLYQQVGRFKKERGAMAMKDIDLFEKTADEMVEEIALTWPVDKRLRLLTPQERLHGLTPEEMLEALSPEQRRQLGGLTPQERLRGLTAEEMVEALSPEQRYELMGLLH